MPVDAGKAADVWLRYQYIRDNGHLEWAAKAKRCNDFFFGLQWDPQDLALLQQYRRPAVTINKIVSTVTNVLGEQIYNRTQVAFRPRNNGATEGTADALTKTMMQISDLNQLDWVRSDVFCDGIVMGRGFYDVRMDFDNNLQGNVQIQQLNPNNVLVDPDAEEYDPDKWGDVYITKWMSVDQIANTYNKDDAEALRGAQESFWPYGYDTLDRDRDRFGTPRAVTYGLGMVAFQGMVRHVRVLDRQYRQNDMMEHFADLRHGDLIPVPTDWDRNRIAQYVQDNPDVTVIKKMASRVRWTVVADKYILHDDWSPYKRFTVVPFFPYFRRGRTMGIVENLLGPQEMLNKVRSQELHVVNTTANSGWKVVSGSLKNMSMGELEARGAQTGLVLEVDKIDNIEKINPNQTPQGLDRISYKAEEDIKAISGVTDYRTGNAREDVSAKAVAKNQSASSANTAKIMDSLTRTDWMLARAVVDLVQEYYTEERLLTIVTDRLTNKTEQVQVNAVGDDGTIVNDLTIGTYDIVVTNQPERDTFEDSQFDHAIQLKEQGVPIPDKYIIQSSKLRDKAEIVKDLEAQANSPEKQQMDALNLRMKQAEVSNIEAQAKQRNDAGEHSLAKAQKDLQGSNPMEAQLEHEREMEKMRAELAMEQERLAMEKQKIDQEMELERYKFEQKRQLEREEFEWEMEKERIKASMETQQQAEQHEQAMQHQERAAANADESAQAQNELTRAQVGQTHAQTAATITNADAKNDVMRNPPAKPAPAAPGGKSGSGK